MNNEGLWPIGILVALFYGVYRLWKHITVRMIENAKRAESMEWKCNHINEPNHDRIACYTSQATTPLIFIFAIIWLFSKA